MNRCLRGGVNKVADPDFWSDPCMLVGSGNFGRICVFRSDPGVALIRKFWLDLCV